MFKILLANIFPSLDSGRVDSLKNPLQDFVYLQGVEEGGGERKG